VSSKYLAVLPVMLVVCVDAKAGFLPLMPEWPAGAPCEALVALLSQLPTVKTPDNPSIVLKRSKTAEYVRTHSLGARAVLSYGFPSGVLRTRSM